MEGLCTCCKILRGDYVHVVKFIGGLCPRCEIQEGDNVHIYKSEQGDFVQGGDLSISRQVYLLALTEIYQEITHLKLARVQRSGIDTIKYHT